MATPSPTSATRNWTIERDRRDVRQQPDQRERVEDRGDRHEDRNHHRGQGPEDEEQDDRRAEPADQRLGEHARTVRVATLRLVERVATGQVDIDARRNGLRERVPNLAHEVLGVESLLSGRVEGRERRAPVVGDVRLVPVRRVERRNAEVGELRGNVADGDGHVVVRRDVVFGAEHDHVRRLGAGAEGLQRALVRLVGRVARDREFLQPAGGDRAGGVRAEHRQAEPGCDEPPPSSHDDVGEPLEHPRTLAIAVGARW